MKRFIEKRFLKVPHHEMEENVHEINKKEIKLEKIILSTRIETKDTTLGTLRKRLYSIEDSEEEGDNDLELLGNTDDVAIQVTEKIQHRLDEECKVAKTMLRHYNSDRKQFVPILITADKMLVYLICINSLITFVGMASNKKLFVCLLQTFLIASVFAYLEIKNIIYQMMLEKDIIFRKLECVVERYVILCDCCGADYDNYTNTDI